MKAITAEQMKELDQLAINDYKIPSLLLMEHAAMAVFKEIKKNHSKKSRILIVCGSGNNGGDGLALARILIQYKYKPTIYLLSEYEKLSDLSKRQYDILKLLKANIVQIEEKEQLDYADNWDIIIDAIFGISLNREIKGIYNEVIEYINCQYAEIISLDLPSGVDASTGNVLGNAVFADKTITFGFSKIGLHLYPAAEYCGKIIVANIGIPKIAFNTLTNNNYYRQEIDIIDKKFLQKLAYRDENSHKGTFGTALIIAGSKQMTGAAMLSAKASYHSGVGIARVLTSENNKNAINNFVPEAICETYNESSNSQNLEELFHAQKTKATAILIGCGLGTDDKAWTLLKLALESDLPLVIDADGLNLLAENPEFLGKLKLRKNKTILTPHIGEMSRLTKFDKSKLLENQLEIARNFAKMNNVILISKDARTIIACPDGKVYLNVKGNNGMATGGSGDVLAGIITGLLANKGNTAETAAITGVYVHALAGDEAANAKGKTALLASDIIDNISKVLK